MPARGIWAGQKAGSDTQLGKLLTPGYLLFHAWSLSQSVLSGESEEMPCCYFRVRHFFPSGVALHALLIVQMLLGGSGGQEGASGNLKYRLASKHCTGKGHKMSSAGTNGPHL